VRLARQLAGGFTVTREALAAGRIEVGQARVIVAAVAALPDPVGAEVRRQAEEHLVALAAEHDEKALRVLGRRVFEVVDPAAADAEEGRRLAGQEARAARVSYLHLFDNGDGTHTGRFKIPSLHAVLLTKMLHALLAGPTTEAGARPDRRAGSRADRGAGRSTPATARIPGTSPIQTTGLAVPSGTAGQTLRQDEPQRDVPRPHDDHPDDVSQPEAATVASGLTRPELMGQALCGLLERFPADRLPRAGGVSARVVVLLDYEKLLSGLGASRLDTGERLSAGMARRLACEAGIIPAVLRRTLGGRSVVLDLGRTTRFHTEHQRIALSIEQGGCTAETCDRPPGWCDAHHDGTSWAHGGGTSVTHGRLLCPFHHRKAHDPHYDMETLPTGRVRFHRMT
jgi:hypothetical protein